MAKKLLKVSAGLSLGFGGLILLLSLLLFATGFFGFLGVVFLIPAMVNLALGGVFLYIANKEDKEFIRLKNTILVLSIISVFLGNIINFILGLISYSSIDSISSGEIDKEVKIKKELTEEEKSQKRLRNLLALGCGLVLLAGIIFAMTTWETLSGFYKTISLIIATLVFFLMSNLAENKFRLKSSAITYYVLANAFLIFGFVSAGYFDVFGTWFSLNGEGSSLYTAFLWLLGSVLSYMAYLKYDLKNMFYIINFSSILGLIYILDFAKVSQDIILFIVTLILGVFALTPKNGEISRRISYFGKIFLPIIGYIVFANIASLNLEDRILFNVLSFGVIFISTYYLAIINKNIFYEVFAPIFSLCTAFVLSTSLVMDNKILLLQFILIAVIIYAIGFSKREQKALCTSSFVVGDLALVYVLMDSINLEYNYYALIAGLISLLVSVIVSISKKFGPYYFEKILEPIKVILLSYALYSFSYKLDYSEKMLFLSLIGLVFSILCLLRKYFIKKLYFIGGVVITLFAVLNSISDFSPISQILNVITLVILFFVTFRAKDRNFLRCNELIYGLSLLSLASVSLNTFSHFKLELIGIILLTVIYLILVIAANKNNILRCFTIVALLIPYIQILPISVWSDNINYILYSLPWLALIFIYTRGFLLSASLKMVNIIEIITLSIWYLIVSSNETFEIAIFIGIISFIAILIGYRSNNWTSLYYTGIAFLIVNTIFALKDFWTTIPIWAYILIAGLILIGIVTYKEYTGVNKKDKVEKIDAEIVEEEKAEEVKYLLDTRTITIGTILYLVVIPMLLQMI